MEGVFIFVKDNTYKKKKKSGGFYYYEKSVCKICKNDFYKRKHKKSNAYCSRSCYLEGVRPNEIYLNNHDSDVIIGSLLSDGCITKSNSKNYYFTHSCKHEEYINFLIEEIGTPLKNMNSKEKNHLAFLLKPKIVLHLPSSGKSGIQTM